MTQNTKDAVQLKPCPFCSCSICADDFATHEIKRHSIKCPDCPCRMEYFSSTKEEAIAAWNRRAPTAEQAEGVRVLTADDADMVWPDYDSETFHHSIDEAVEYEVDQAGPVDGELELKVQLAKRIPTATIRIFNITESGHEWEIVAAPASSAGDQA